MKEAMKIWKELAWGIDLSKLDWKHTNDEVVLRLIESGVSKAHAIDISAQARERLQEDRLGHFVSHPAKTPPVERIGKHQEAGPTGHGQAIVRRLFGS